MIRVSCFVFRENHGRGLVRSKKKSLMSQRSIKTAMTSHFVRHSCLPCSTYGPVRLRAPFSSVRFTPCSDGPLTHIASPRGEKCRLVFPPPPSGSTKRETSGSVSTPLDLEDFTSVPVISIRLCSTGVSHGRRSAWRSLSASYLAWRRAASASRTRAATLSKTPRTTPTCSFAFVQSSCSIASRTPGIVFTPYPV